MYHVVYFTCQFIYFHFRAHTSGRCAFIYLFIYLCIYLFYSKNCEDFLTRCIFSLEYSFNCNLLVWPKFSWILLFFCLSFLISVFPTQDEIDALTGVRGVAATAGGGVESRILSTLLNEMDGIEAATGIVVVGATNRSC